MKIFISKEKPNKLDLRSIEHELWGHPSRKLVPVA